MRDKAPRSALYLERGASLVAIEEALMRLFFIMIGALLSIANAHAQSTSESIVERVRSTVPYGVSEISLDFAGPHLRISGAAKSGAQVARLINNLTHDVAPNVNLIELLRLSIRGGVEFKLTILDVGRPNDWNDPITLHFPLALNASPHVNPQESVVENPSDHGAQSHR